MEFYSFQSKFYGEFLEKPWDFPGLPGGAQLRSASLSLKLFMRKFELEAHLSLHVICEEV
jgi:hypothetical protein